jgi:hypothetical protein
MTISCGWHGPGTAQAVAASDMSLLAGVAGSRVLLIKNLAHAPLAAWIVLRAFGRMEKPACFQPFQSFITSEGAKPGKPPASL